LGEEQRRKKKRAYLPTVFSRGPKEEKQRSFYTLGKGGGGGRKLKEGRKGGKRKGDEWGLFFVFAGS